MIFGRTSWYAVSLNGQIYGVLFGFCPVTGCYMFLGCVRVCAHVMVML